jgi:hypothetical protein
MPTLLEAEELLAGRLVAILPTIPIRRGPLRPRDAEAASQPELHFRLAAIQQEPTRLRWHLELRDLTTVSPPAARRPLSLLEQLLRGIDFATTEVRLLGPAHWLIVLEEPWRPPTELPLGCFAGWRSAAVASGTIAEGTDSFPGVLLTPSAEADDFLVLQGIGEPQVLGPLVDLAPLRTLLCTTSGVGAGAEFVVLHGAMVAAGAVEVLRTEPAAEHQALYRPVEGGLRIRIWRAPQQRFVIHLRSLPVSQLRQWRAWLAIHRRFLLVPAGGELFEAVWEQLESTAHSITLRVAALPLSNIGDFQQASP